MVTAIALINAATNRIPDLAACSSDTMRLRDGIVEAETMSAFRAYARLQLETGLDLGLD